MPTYKMKFEKIILTFQFIHKEVIEIPFYFNFKHQFSEKSFPNHEYKRPGSLTCWSLPLRTGTDSVSFTWVLKMILNRFTPGLTATHLWNLWWSATGIQQCWVTDFGGEMCWWQLRDVTDCLRQLLSPLSFYIRPDCPDTNIQRLSPTSRCHQHHNVTKIRLSSKSLHSSKSPTNLLETGPEPNNFFELDDRFPNLYNWVWPRLNLPNHQLVLI